MKPPKRYKSATLLSMVLGLVLVTQGIGCTPGFNLVAEGPMGGLVDSSNVGTGADSNSDLKVIPGTKTVSVVYSKQVLDQMTSCLGVQSPSDQTVSMYQQKKGAISTYGLANTITSPMMMAIVSVAGEVCNDLIVQEATTRRLFKDIDLASTNVPDASALRNAMARISLSCWQRPVETAEVEVLTELVMGTVKNGDARASRNASLLLCTSMLSSLDALLN